MTSTETTRTLVAGRLLDVNRAATTNDTVRRTVKALHGFYGVAVEELARAVGVSRATMFTRLNGKTDFTIGEVAVLADLFECSLDDLHKGRLNLETPPENGRTRRSTPFRAAAPQTYEAAPRTVLTPEYLPPKRHLVAVDSQVTDPAPVTPREVVPNLRPSRAIAGVIPRVNPEQTSECAGAA